MAKTLASFSRDIRTYLGKGKVRQARKAIDKAIKAGVEGIAELEMEVRLAEGNPEGAAEVLRRLAADESLRLAAPLKTADLHLRKHPKDIAFRDAVWEAALSRDQFDLATRQLSTLVAVEGFDPGARAQALLGRKDAVGATGIFMLATFGGITTDRIKLADRLLGNEQGSELLSGVVGSLQKRGMDDGAVNYVLAQVAKRRGDHDAFVEYAGKAFDEMPEEVWTWTETNATTSELLEIAAHKGSLTHLLKAARSAEADAIVAAAQKAKSEGATGGTLRALALLVQGKAPNACRVIEKTIADHSEAVTPVGELLHDKRGDWPGAHAVCATVLGAGDEVQVGRACDSLLQAENRDDAWLRVAPRLVDRAPGRDDLRLELGRAWLERGESVLDLVQAERHLELAEQWAKEFALDGEVLRKAAELAEESGSTSEHADWILSAARGDPELLAELGRALAGGAHVSVDTALRSASALLDQGSPKEAAAMLAQLPLDPESGQAQQKFLFERKAAERKEFASVAFRSALARGDVQGARKYFEAAPGNVQALSREAGRHADAARVLAEVLIEQGKGEVAVPMLEERRQAGDEARALLPLVDTLLKSAPKLGIARLLRGRLLHAMNRERDAVRDLCMVGDEDGGAETAFQLLGRMLGGSAAGPAALGRADILIAKGDPLGAVEELDGSHAAPAERLARYEKIIGSHPDLDVAKRARGYVLEAMGKLPDAAAAHLERLGAKGADVASDVEGLAARALAASDLDTVSTLLERLAAEAEEGAARGLKLIERDDRPPMLVLRAKLSLQQGRPENAVESLRTLVHNVPGARADAAQALQEIVEGGQARPESDFALAEAHRVMDNVPAALGTLRRLYEDDITDRGAVRAAAEEIVRAHDESEVRVFLSRIALDQKDPKSATENAIHARRLRPDARREVVGLLQKALDQDAFSARTHFALAEAHLAGDEADDAVRHFRAAVEVERKQAQDAIDAMSEAAPNSKHTALLYFAIGSTHADFLRAHAQAIEAFTKGLDANPTTELKVSLLLGRGDAFAAIREDDKAFDDFDAASHLDRLERRYYEFLRVNHRKREAHRAEEAARSATEDFKAAVEACGKFIRVGRLDEAVTVAQGALAAKPSSASAKYLVGVALHAAERYDAAVQVLEAVRQEAAADSEIGRAARMLLAESYLDRGDRTDARACLTEIESVDADYPGLRARRAALAPPADDPQAPPPLIVRPEFPRPTE
ncbi:MAG: tetratricopeptide repeat protein [Planctomycetota bacterium]